MITKLIKIALITALSFSTSLFAKKDEVFFKVLNEAKKAAGEIEPQKLMQMIDEAQAKGKIPGFPPEWPATGNLTSGKGSRLPAWGEAGFIEIIREGEKHGRAIHPDYMPWTSYRHMTDLELKVVYQYLMSLPPLEFGNH